MFDDLKNPVASPPAATPGLFPQGWPGPVKFTPVIALGLATRTRGGWYPAVADRVAPQEGRPVVVRLQELGRRPANRQELAAGA